MCNGWIRGGRTQSRVRGHWGAFMNIPKPISVYCNTTKRNVAEIVTGAKAAKGFRAVGQLKPTIS